LIVGVAGSSSGLEIARRFGIKNEIIAAAAAGVKESSLQATEYLQRIKQDAETAAALTTALEEERTAVAEKFASLERDAEKREREREWDYQKRLGQIVSDFEKRSRELIATIQDRAERLKVEREAQRRTSELKREAQRAGSSAGPSTDATSASRGVRVMREGNLVNASGQSPAPNISTEESAYVPAPARDIVVGDKVKLRSFGSIGIVDSIKNGEAELRVKSLRLREKLENLELVAEVQPIKSSGRFAKLRETHAASIQAPISETSVSSELNVIGQRTDEAIDAVDKFLDAASLAGTSELRIVHGHGTGALRRAIGELLKDHPHVARFKPAPQDQGGSGATLVELRQ
jgi:DNA mismatch repair protein MutS2